MCDIQLSFLRMISEQTQGHSWELQLGEHFCSVFLIIGIKRIFICISINSLFTQFP